MILCILNTGSVSFFLIVTIHRIPSRVALSNPHPTREKDRKEETTTRSFTQEPKSVSVRGPRTTVGKGLVREGRSFYTVHPRPFRLPWSKRRDPKCRHKGSHRSHRGPPLDVRGRSTKSTLWKGKWTWVRFFTQ